jgi:hypothetical protein
LFKKLCWLVLIFFLIVQWGHSQQLPSRQYTTADGLPNNAIRSLLLDSRGILWIGTENGVSKLENGVFQNFYESDGLAFNSCWAIAEDKNKHLWFGSYGGGVSFFDGNTFKIIREEDGLADNRIRHFYPYGEFMLIGTEDGISMVHLETLETTTIASSIRNSDLNYTTGFWEAEGRLFYSTYRSGSFEIHWENGIPKTQKINDWLPIYAVLQEEKNLLLSDKGSLKSISHSDFQAGKTPEVSFGQSIIWNKIPGPNQETYLLAAGLFSKDGGIFQLENGLLTDQTTRFGIDSKFIQTGVLDSQRGLIYLGTLDKGLYKVRVDGSLIYEEFGEKEVKGIAGNYLLLGLLHSQGLEIRDLNSGKIRQTTLDQFKQVQVDFYRRFPLKIPKHMDGFFELDPKIPASELEFYELHFQPTGFWINSNLGIFQLDLEGKITNYLPVHSYSMGFTPDGKLLETNPYAGVRMYENPSEFTYTYFPPEDSSTPLQISKVVSGKVRTYLASVFHGFYQWDGSKFFSYLKEGIWDEAKFKSLHTLENGEVLVGTEFGELYQIRPYPNFEILRKWDKEELQGTSILALESYRDAILVVTEKGIHILQGEKNRFRDEEQGFYEKVFLSAKRIGDLLYLGTTKGFYTVNLPEFIQNQPDPIGLSITELKINHQPISREYFDWFAFQPRNLELASGQNTLSLRFKPTGQLGSDKIRYRYRLKPEADWTEYFSDPVLELPFLPSGKYQLEVEVWDYHSGSLSRISLLDFSIEKPFYLQLWFILLMVLGLASLFVLVYRIRSQQFKAKALLNQRLTEIKLEALRSQMNPHFTFNAINSIQYYILKNDTQQALTYLSKFSSLIRSTLDQSTKSQISLAEEVEYLTKYIEVENMRMDNRVNWEITGDALDRSNEIFISPMLIQPLVENVFVHAFSSEHPNPRLTIDYNLISETQIRCQVKDNGDGSILPSQPNHDSKGINLIRKKLSLLPGYSEDNLTFQQDENGYAVTLVIPYSQRM